MMTIDEVLLAAEADCPNKNTRVSVNFFELRRMRRRAVLTAYLTDEELRAAVDRYRAPKGKS